jgi:hypothetical protein
MERLGEPIARQVDLRVDGFLQDGRVLVVAHFLGGLERVEHTATVHDRASSISVR